MIQLYFDSYKSSTDSEDLENLKIYSEDLEDLSVEDL